jgi:hypothetical protein
MIIQMSQSDYIERKKVSTKLSGISKTPIDNGDFPNVLNAQEYTLFSQYQITNTVLNSKLTPNELVAPNRKIVFNMEVLASNNCPSFTLCRNTNTRQNRVLQRGFVMHNGIPVTVPIQKYVKKGANSSNCTIHHSCSDDNGACCRLRGLRTMPSYT